MIKKNVLFIGGSSQIAIALARKIKDINCFNLSRRKNKFYKKNLILNNYNTSEIKRKISKINEKFDTIFLFNGIYKQSTLSFFDEKAFKEITNINLIIPIRITSLIISSGILNKNASINFITSWAGIKPEIGNAYYAISKNSLIFASKIFSKELEKRKIRFNSISLGLIKSRMSSILLSKLPRTRKKFKSNFISLNRVLKIIIRTINNTNYNGRNFIIN